MRKYADYLFGLWPVNLAGFRQRYDLILSVCLLAVLSACNANRPDSARGQRMRLTVGDINEVSLSAPPDTTYQLAATSDNQEVVDVSRKPSDPAAPNGPQLTRTGPIVFLIKGVTAGTAKVVFSEKPTGADGTGRVKRTYLVTVANK